MKPSVTVDERGVLLHVTNAAGEGFAVPLNGETVSEIGAQLARAKSKLLTPEGKSRVARALSSLFWQLVEEEDKNGG